MKFENERFRIIVEKKPLPEEERERKRIKRKKAVKLVLALSGVVFVCIVLFFLFKMNPYMWLEGEYVTASHLAQAAKTKYKDKNLNDYTYGEPIKGLKRDETIRIPIGFDFEKADIICWNELFAIYQDPELTYPLAPVCEYDKKKGEICIAPPRYTVGNINTYGLTVEEVRKYEHSDYQLFDKDTGNDWGNAGILYLAKYADMETGEALEKPEVSIITLEGEVKENPRIVFAVSEDGRASLSWEPIEDAEEYFVCLIKGDDEVGLDGNAWPIAVTEECSWVLESPAFSEFAITNEEFRNFDVCEDEWLDADSAARAEEWYGITEGVYREDKGKEKYLCVIAVNTDGTSMFSNMYAVSDIASNLPYQTAVNAEKANGFKANGYESIEQVSAYGYVTMCDGYTAAKLIDYETEKAQVIEERYVSIDEEGNYIGGEDIPVLTIPYVIEGTPFEYVAKVIDYDEADLEKDMQFLEEREDRLRKKPGNVSLSIKWGIEEEAPVRIPREQKIRELENVKITANCALSEYLAAGMLGGAKVIDLTEFPEAGDPEFLADAWMEAYYQNPLILGAEGYRANKKGTAIRVEYDEDAAAAAGKQKKILEKVKNIIGEIISDDMTELEKELAINQYLCDTVEYDEEALANAEENNFVCVDDAYKDSFTAYGALINGKSVCGGYAAAFKLLAGEAGLESVVVTGFLEGSLPHAWNKVKIDGEWEILDVTNNDNEYLFNALLNLPDYAGDRVLIEDKDYVLDRCLFQYDATQEGNEYYRINRKYFDYKKIAKKLIEGLEEDGSVVLRTEYDLDDDMFYEITDSIHDILGEDADLYGHYWMGVIYLRMEE